MTSPLRSVNIGHVNRLMEAVRIGGEFEVEKFLRHSFCFPLPFPRHMRCAWPDTGLLAQPGESYSI